MGKFVYISSKDELEWHCDIKNTPYAYLGPDELAISKLYFRIWIEESCQGTVFVWNGVSTPDGGDLYWGKKIVPQGDATLYFEDPRDYTLFRLKYVPDN